MICLVFYLAYPIVNCNWNCRCLELHHNHVRHDVDYMHFSWFLDHLSFIGLVKYCRIRCLHLMDFRCFIRLVTFPMFEFLISVIKYWPWRDWGGGFFYHCHGLFVKDGGAMVDTAAQNGGFWLSTIPLITLVLIHSEAWDHIHSKFKLTFSSDVQVDPQDIVMVWMCFWDFFT